jgi:hypothetical protein
MAVVERPAHVRPWLRRVAIIAFIVLVPIALHTAWDHYEARRLSRIVSEIRARNEPVSSVTQRSARAEEPDNAARYYEAAAALVDARDTYGVTGLGHKMSYAPEAERSQVVQEVRAWLERNAEAEKFLARATDLPFEGYPPGTGYSYRTDRLLKLARLANFRTFERLEARDGEGAAQSVVQQLRLNRALGASGQAGMSMTASFWTANVPLREISRVIEAAPSNLSLQRVQAAIRDVDEDAAIEQSIVAQRAFYLGNYWDESRGWYARQRDVSNDALWYVKRPLKTRRFVQTIEIMTTLVDRSRQPWPVRLHVDVPDKLPGSPRGFPFLPAAQAYHMLGSSYRSQATSIASSLALLRTADAAIAVELYRRRTGRMPKSLAELVPAYIPAVPVDPFSGREIRYVRSSDRVVAYSVGKNEKDDGGVKVEYPVWRSGAFQNRGEPPDLGVTIPLSPRSKP